MEFNFYNEETESLTFTETQNIQKTN